MHNQLHFQEVVCLHKVDSSEYKSKVCLTLETGNITVSHTNLEKALPESLEH